MSTSKFSQLIQASRNSNNYNFISLTGGKFLIPADLEERFWRYYARDTTSHALVYSLPTRTHLPLTFDLDIVHRTPVNIPDKKIASLMHIIAEETMGVTGVKSGLTFYGLRKPAPTKKVTKNDGIFWKNGAHVLVQGLLVTREIAHKIRSNFLERDPVHVFCQEFEVTDKNELLDESDISETVQAIREDVISGVVDE